MARLLALLITLALWMGPASAADPAPLPPAGADNYLIPVPPDLPQRQLEANKRADIHLRAEEQQEKAEQERAAQQNPPTDEPSAPPAMTPNPGIIYK